MFVRNLVRRISTRGFAKVSLCRMAARVSFVVLELTVQAAAVPSANIWNQRIRMFATASDSEAAETQKIGENYQKLTQREHILKRPDSYSMKLKANSLLISWFHCNNNTADVGV